METFGRNLHSHSAEEWWYPKGDIFSMGIVFFQLMIGQVPNGEVIGVLQTTGETEEVGGEIGDGCLGTTPRGSFQIPFLKLQRRELPWEVWHELWREHHFQAPLFPPQDILKIFCWRKNQTTIYLWKKAGSSTSYRNFGSTTNQNSRTVTAAKVDKNRP